MIEAVVFDMDGILFDTERLTLRLWKKICESEGYPDVTVYGSEFMGMNHVAHRQYFEKRFGKEFPYDAFMALGRKAVLEEIAKNGVPVKPGLFELLGYLKEHRLRIAAATSTQRKTAVGFFESTKIIGYFDAMICGDMVEKSKPDPDIYRKAAAALNAKPEHCMALEDSPNGIRSAYNAGMKTVMVPDLVAPSPELDKLLFACVPALNDVIPLIETENRQ